MADGMTFPHVITNDILHFKQTHSDPTRESPELSPPGPLPRVVTKPTNFSVHMSLSVHPTQNGGGVMWKIDF